MAKKGRNGVTKSWDDIRPKNYYRDCLDKPRPCPWVGCKHHLLLDVNEETGTITLNVGRVMVPSATRRRKTTLVRRVNVVSEKNKSPGAVGVQNKKLDHATSKLFEEFESIVGGSGRMTCVLDCVEGETSHTLEQVGDLFGVTRERIRQIESRGRKKLKDLSDRKGCEEWTELKD